MDKSENRGNPIININWLTGLLGVIILCISGCTVGPDYIEPEMILPDAWHQKTVEGVTQGQADFQTWWTIFNDPVLNSLIEHAQTDNLDVQSAVARIEQSRALLGVASGQYWPGVDAAGFYNHARASENGLTPAVGTTNLHNIGIDATWEIDVFGRISRSVESAQASYEASVEDYRDVLVSLCAEVALTYVEIRTQEVRIQYALENIETQKDSVDLTNKRYKNEISSELDVRQAELNLANTESALPLLRKERMQAIYRLSVLLGMPPEALVHEIENTATIPEMDQYITIGLPTELLRQRPDVRRAERLLAAQTAQIGVTTAGLYPSFSLSGTFALEAQDIGDVGRWDSRTYGFGPAFRWNLFDGDRVKSAIQFEEALTQEYLLQYEQTVLNGLREVEEAMVGYKEEQIRVEALHRSVNAAKRSVELVNSLYVNGLVDFQNVLDMERALASQQDNLAASRGRAVQNIIALYKALGGGWSLEQEQGNQDNPIE